MGAGHVGVGGAGEDAVGVEADHVLLLVEEVVGGVAVEQGGGEHHDQALLAVGDVDEAVVQADGLLLVFRAADAQRVEGEGGGGGDAGGEFGGDVETLAERGDGGGDDALGEALVVDVGDVEDDEAGLAGGGVEVFAALEEVEDLALAVVVVGLGEDGAVGGDVGVVIFRIREAVEVAAEGGLGLVALGPDDGVEAVVAGGDVGVAAEEVDRAGAEAEELGHPGVVVVLLGEVAVGAVLGRADGGRGVGEVGVEGLARVALGGDGLLLGIDPLAVGVLRADDDGGGGADDGEAVVFVGGVLAEHEDVVAHDLGVVGGVEAGGGALEFVARDLLVGLEREVAAEAGRDPAGVADLATDVGVAVGEVGVAVEEGFVGGRGVDF